MRQADNTTLAMNNDFSKKEVQLVRTSGREQADVDKSGELVDSENYSLVQSCLARLYLK